MERTCQDVLTLFAEYQSWVEGAPGQQIECSLVGHQGFLALQNRVSYSTMNTKDQPTHGFHHIVVRRWREYWFRKNAEPRFHQIAQSMDISPFSDGVFAPIVCVLESIDLGRSTGNAIFGSAVSIDLGNEQG